MTAGHGREYAHHVAVGQLSVEAALVEAVPEHHVDARGGDAEPPERIGDRSPLGQLELAAAAWRSAREVAAQARE